MEKRNYTIGMAGHIDHGKTTLTKALTNVETDRLKEEKERQISIELGFAPFYLDDSMQVSIIDVPGHERFIRQMIAGVAGIDLVLLVIAADEGVMPQTKEHLEILSFLGIKRGIVVVSKIDMVEAELLELVIDDIKEQLVGTIFADSPLVLIDSHSKKGIPHLKDVIVTELQKIETRNLYGAFRLPIDQVFTVKGHGTVVRGTVYEGTLNQGEMVTILPEKLETKARQLQVHNHPINQAQAGLRVAINLSNVAKGDLKRGDVLVSSNSYIVTDTIDVSLRIVKYLTSPIKQRTLIKCHLGTAEVMGKIVFFDRNEIDDSVDEILCQLRLNEPLVTKRGDRFILRRPTPVETIGGGWVIDPNGKKYRFGIETIKSLESKKEGTPKERMINIFETEKLLSLSDIVKKVSIDEKTLQNILHDDDFTEIEAGIFTTSRIIQQVNEQIVIQLQTYHQEFPMKFGVNKAELLQHFSASFPKRLLEFVLEKGVGEEKLRKSGQFVQWGGFQPHYPETWAKRMEGLLDALKSDGLSVKTWQEYLVQAGIPGNLADDFKYLLMEKGEIYSLDEKTNIHKDPIRNMIAQLRENTNDMFELKEAKEILHVSRKYLVPLLELLDVLKVTTRGENKRVWNDSK